MDGIDWDALAPYWHHFEGQGFTVREVAWIESGLRPPCLLVGAGLGAVLRRLAGSLGGLVIGVERSTAMASRCRPGVGVLVAADAASLPFRDGAFASALVVTGVLEPAHSREAILREVARVSTGEWLAAVTQTSESAQDMWELLDAWRRDPSDARAATFQEIAEELGDRDAAYRLLRRALPRDPVVVAPGELEAAASVAGLGVEGRLTVASDTVVYRLGTGTRS